MRSGIRLCTAESEEEMFLLQVTFHRFYDYRSLFIDN